MEASWCTWQIERRTGSRAADGGVGLTAMLCSPGPLDPMHGVQSGPAHHHVYRKCVLGHEVLQLAQHREHLLLPHLHGNQLLHQRWDLGGEGKGQE